MSKDTKIESTILDICSMILNDGKFQSDLFGGKTGHAIRLFAKSLVDSIIEKEYEGEAKKMNHENCCKKHGCIERYSIDYQGCAVLNDEKEPSIECGWCRVHKDISIAILDAEKKTNQND